MALGCLSLLAVGTIALPRLKSFGIWPTGPLLVFMRTWCVLFSHFYFHAIILWIILFFMHKEIYFNTSYLVCLFSGFKKFIELLKEIFCMVLDDSKTPNCSHVCLLIWGGASYFGTYPNALNHAVFDCY